MVRYPCSLSECGCTITSSHDNPNDIHLKEPLGVGEAWQMVRDNALKGSSGETRWAGIPMQHHTCVASLHPVFWGTSLGTSP